MKANQLFTFQLELDARPLMVFSSFEQLYHVFVNAERFWIPGLATILNAFWLSEKIIGRVFVILNGIFRIIKNTYIFVFIVKYFYATPYFQVHILIVQF